MNIPAISPLFYPMPDFARQGLDLLPHALSQVLPMNHAQSRDLIYACRDLSAQLTTDRTGHERPYWASIRLASAYMRYFLPWNLVRLCSLLPTLPIQLAEEGMMVDLGSGPLTLPLALWLSRPDLRQQNITILAVDTAPRPLDLGKQLFIALAAQLGQKVQWQLRTLRAPIHNALREVRGKPQIISMGNVLNEMEDQEKRGHPALLPLLHQAHRMLGENGQILAVEPGTRQGGRTIAALRDAALGLDQRVAGRGGRKHQASRQQWDSFSDAQDDDFDDADDFDDYYDDQQKAAPMVMFYPQSPCPHNNLCPMNGRGRGPWCHVNTPVRQAPEFLRSISQKAGMDKESVSLAFVLLGRQPQANETVEPNQTAPTRARVLSEAFSIPGYPGRAKYACSPEGLCLIINCAFTPPGALVKIKWVQSQDGRSLKDAKSGALLADLLA